MKDKNPFWGNNLSTDFFNTIYITAIIDIINNNISPLLIILVINDKLLNIQTIDIVKRTKMIKNNKVITLILCKYNQQKIKISNQTISTKKNTFTN